MLAGWKFASVECGEPYAMMVSGITMMPQSCADNWGTV